MAEFVKKLRGALGIGITWGAVWGAVFVGLGLIAGLVGGSDMDPAEAPFIMARAGAVFGFVSGLGFGALLAAAEGRKTIRNLSLSRAALWGVMGTALIPLLTPVADSMLFIVCPIGAGLAAASVAIARRAELNGAPEHRELPR